jgi:hypothetical protein
MRMNNIDLTGLHKINHLTDHAYIIGMPPLNQVHRHATASGLGNEWGILRLSMSQKHTKMQLKPSAIDGPVCFQNGLTGPSDFMRIPQMEHINRPH